MIPKIKDICETPVKNCHVLLIALPLSCILEKLPRGGKHQSPSLNAIVSKRVRYTVIEKKQNRDRKPQQKNELHRRLRSICTKLDEGIEEAGIGIAVGNDTISDFTVNNYVALKLNIRRGTLILSVPLGYRLFFRLGVFRLKALMSFPNSSSAGLDGNSPQVSQYLTAKSNGRTGLSGRLQSVRNSPRGSIIGASRKISTSAF